MNIQELEPLIIEWANAKRLVKRTPEQALVQLDKTQEEVGKLEEAIEKCRCIEDKLPEGIRSFATGNVDKPTEAIKLKAGDVLVTLVIQCAIQRVGELVDRIECERDFITWIDAKDEALTQIYICSFLNKELMGSAIAQLARWVESAIGPYGLTLDECLESAWLKIQAKQNTEDAQ